MTNSLIPYSFIPGTKAKAQEVNANFIALANQITENKEYTDTKINETMSDVSENRADIKLENTNLVSNCILEAPNGIVSFTGNTITVKSALKVRIADGKNEDGSLKNIDYTLQSDTLLTTTSNDYVNCVYITPTTVATAEMYHCSVTTPIYKGGLWFQPEQNKHYLYNAGSSTWEEINAIVVAAYQNSTEQVQNVETVPILGLLKESDMQSIISFGIPDYENIITKESGKGYISPVNGYVFGFGQTDSGLYKYLIIDGNKFPLGLHPSGHSGWAGLALPVAKGSAYSVSGTNCQLKFIPLKGEV